MNEVQRLAQQVEQLQLILEDMQRTLQQMAAPMSYGSSYVRSQLSARLGHDTTPVPRQSEFASYARDPFH